MGESASSLWITGEENGFPRPFGNYLLLAAFAQGGMGELFLAMSGSVAGAFRLCVVKKLRPDLTNDRQYVNRFIDEAKVVVQLNHANISHVFDVGRIDGQFYLAMEFVSGVSVKRLVARAHELKTQLPPEISLHIAREVLEALDYAHHHTHPITGEPLRVVHRDVSPQNILVSWAGEVKLIDFGLALSVLKDEQTATGTVMGKVAYMPPEQARGDDVDASCDQFATAVITYEMLVGERYHGDLPLHAIWAIAGMGNFPPPKWTKLPRELQILLGRALSNDKENRYKSCGDLREALGAYMAAHHPATSSRTLRDLLDNWFRDYRAEERELLSRFKDVTGAKVREAVKSTTATVESLLSGPHMTSSVAAGMPGASGIEWTMPKTDADASGQTPGSGSSKLHLPLAAQPDLSRSMPIMPPPLSPPLSQIAGSGAGVASVGLPNVGLPPFGGATLPPPLAPPAHTPVPLPSLASIPPPTSTPPAALPPPPAPLSQPMPAMPPLQSMQQMMPVPAPTPLPMPATAQPPAPPVVVTAVTPAVPTTRLRAPEGTLSATHAAEPTQRMRAAVGTSSTTSASARRGVDDDDEIVRTAVRMERRKVWGVAAAAVVAVTVVLVVAVGFSGKDVPPPKPPPPDPVHVAPPPPDPTPPDPTPTVVDPPTPHVDIVDPGKVKRPKKVSPSDPPHDVAPPDPTPTPPTTNDADDKAARRARDRIGALKRSKCSDPCVQRVVDQFETTPAAIQLEGFQSSVDACVSACGK